MISFSQRVKIVLIYTPIGLTCNTLIKVKNSICKCSIVSRVFIYASNKPLCGTLIIKLRKYLCISLQPDKNILCKNHITIQNMC